MAITAEAVKQLRERTGAGFMDCKRALEETDGDVDKAVALLRERGAASAEKKAGREAKDGLVASYIHTGGRIGVLIEVNAETDFVARNEQFQTLVRNLAMQVAGLKPSYVERGVDPRGRPRGEEAGDPGRPGHAGTPGERSREDRRRPAPEVVRAGRAARAAVP